VVYFKGRKSDFETGKTTLLQEERRRQTELERQRRLMAFHEVEQDRRRQIQERLRQQEERNRQAARQEERDGVSLCNKGITRVVISQNIFSE